MILQTLYQQCLKRNVEFYDEYYVLDLLMSEGRAAGVVAYDLATGQVHVFRAKSVVFATGGFGKVFRTTSNAHTLTGDGMGIVYRHGLPLEDMEFYQFHPTGLAGLGVLLSEAARGEGGILRNRDGERFMERYAPTIKDLAPRDMVARAMANEVREGRGSGPDSAYVLLDLTHLPREQIDAKLPDITEFARTYLGVEPYDEPIPVFPTAHYAMGGIPTDITGQVLSDNTTPVPGLFAAGRSPACRCTGRTGWAPTRCSTSTSSAGGPVRLPAAYAVRAPLLETGDDPAAGVVALLEDIRQQPGDRAGRRHPVRPAGDHGPECAGVPHRGVAQAGAGRHRRTP
jgi:succinate dehydrogenase / fumarate reductase flavoprotein subunit